MDDSLKKAVAKSVARALQKQKAEAKNEALQEESRVADTKLCVQELQLIVSNFSASDMSADDQGNLHTLVNRLKASIRHTPQSNHNKVLRVLQSQSRVGCPVTLVEIAGDTDLPQAVVLVVLDQLVDAGDVERRSPGGYRNSGRNGTKWLYLLIPCPPFESS